MTKIKTSINQPDIIALKDLQANNSNVVVKIFVLRQGSEVATRQGKTIRKMIFIDDEGTMIHGLIFSNVIQQFEQTFLTNRSYLVTNPFVKHQRNLCKCASKIRANYSGNNGGYGVSRNATGPNAQSCFFQFASPENISPHTCNHEFNSQGLGTFLSFPKHEALLPFSSQVRKTSARIHVIMSFTLRAWEHFCPFQNMKPFFPANS